MRIDPVARLAYWQEQEVQASINIQRWIQYGDKMSPGAISRARDWYQMVTELVEGWTKAVNNSKTVTNNG